MNQITRFVLMASTLFLSIVANSSMADAVRFGVIGDYGVDNSTQAAVAARLKTLSPEFLVTTGDNTYFSGTVANWDRTQGKHYGEFIKYPAGSTSAYAGNGVTSNNFYPTMGNHDWDAGLNSYTSYFELPGNERYYSVKRGPVEIFVLSSDSRETDGRSSTSAQYLWAQNAIQTSTAKWQMVFFHHPAYTYASNHGPETAMRWPFKSWGVDATFAGHNHNMQAMDVNGLPVFVRGASGNGLYGISGAPSGATGLFSNASANGFSIVDATESSLRVRFLDVNGNTLYTQEIPEPTSLSLLCIGVIGIVARRR